MTISSPDRNLAQASAGTAAASRGQRWLLLFNCQAEGMGNCLSLLSRGIEVQSHDPVSVRQNKDTIQTGAGRYDRVVLASGVRAATGLEIDEKAANLWQIPPTMFTGFHPDVFFANTATGGLTGPLGNCHSIIAYVAWSLGMSPEKAIGLFRADVYDALGYHAHWHAARDQMVASYQGCGLDIRQRFVEWTRRGQFMHIPTHPDIHVLRDLAELLLRKAGLDVVDTRMLPHDNLAKGPVYPLYPELGARLGMKGSYDFKIATAYSTIGLEEFVTGSFSRFAAARDITPFDRFAPMVQNAFNVLGGMA